MHYTNFCIYDRLDLTSDQPSCRLPIGSANADVLIHIVTYPFELSLLETLGTAGRAWRNTLHTAHTHTHVAIKRQLAHAVVRADNTSVDSLVTDHVKCDL